MTTQWLLLLTALTAMILPAPPEPKAKKLSRGPGFTQNLESIKVSADAIAAAKDRSGNPQRVAVVAADDIASKVVADLLQSGLQYGKGLVVVGWEASPLSGSTIEDPAKLIQSAKENSIDVVALVRFEDSKGQIRIFKTMEGEDAIRDIAIAREDLIDAAVQARREVLNSLNSTTGGNDDELAKQPDATVKALENLVMAKSAFFGAAGVQNQADREERFQKAVEYSRQAIEQSPRLVAAYVVKASAHDELGEVTERDRTIAEARGHLSTQQNDALTVLELQADHERFKGNISKSLEHYLEILTLNPSSLTARWAVMDILLTGDGRSDINPDDRQTVEQLAAEIVVLHPHSAVAKALR